MEIYLVGGAVRDKLLGFIPHEYDWVVVGSSVAEMEALGYEQVGKDFPVFLHPESKEEHALARTERKSGKGYTGFSVSFDPTVTLEQDLARRDLTINAIAEHPDGQLVDPFGGQKDIEQRVLRHVSAAFTEDPLRVLRIARFWARFAHLGFTIASSTCHLLKEMAASGELTHLTPERVWKEWEKSLSTRSPEKFLQLLLDIDACQQVLPQLRVNATTLDNLMTVASACNVPELRFAAMFLSQPEGFNLHAFCRQHAIPNRFKETAQLALLQSDTLTQKESLEPGQLFILLKSIDYWRRPERLQQFLQLRAALSPVQEPLATIEKAALAARQINAQQLLATGLTGAELGKALEQQRKDTFLNAFSQA